MKIGLAQMEVLPGMPSKNVEKMLHFIDLAKAKGCDIVAFPELCVSGYLVGDRWTEDNYCKDLMSFNDTLAQASKGISLIYGNVYVEHGSNTKLMKGYHPNKDGRSRKYNAIYCYFNGEPVQRVKESPFLPPGVQPKTLLPTYRFFDDSRYFFSLLDVALDFNVELTTLLQPFLIPVTNDRIKVGLELCEDLWCEDYRINGNSINPSKSLIQNGASLLINISASPWTFGKNAARDRRVTFISRDCGDTFVPLLYVNCVGVQNNGKNFITFDGGSTVYNKHGEPVQFSREVYKEELLLVDTRTLAGSGKQRVEGKKVQQQFSAIINAIPHLNVISGRERADFGTMKFVVGMSGGVDSSVVAALLVLAAGKERVIGVNMPTQFNTEQTKNIAAHVANELHIPLVVIPIGSLVDQNRLLLENALQALPEQGSLSELVEENIQAKIRGTSILSNFAAAVGGVFTNNGNKVEIATGYATLYGDVGGAIAPIGDLTKREVFELARFLNETVFKREVIPGKLLPDERYGFETPPSAELKEAQVDPFKWGYHDRLLELLTDYRKRGPEDFIAWYLEGTLAQHLQLDEELLRHWGLDDPQTFINDLEWFCSLIAKNVFKRVQAPPIIVLSKSAYGYDIRESQLAPRFSRKFEKLKRRLLVSR